MTLNFSVQRIDNIQLGIAKLFIRALSLKPLRSMIAIQATYIRQLFRFDFLGLLRGANIHLGPQLNPHS